MAINHDSLRTSLCRARTETNGQPSHRPSPTGSNDGAPPPPPVAIEHMSFEDAMDPQKRAAFADQILKKKPLVIQPKRKT